MKENDNHIGRISLIILALLILAMLVRIIILQNSDNIDRKRYSDPIVSSSLVRGTIYDRNGNILAIQAPDYGFAINLTSSTPSYVASILDPYLPYDAIEIETLIKKGETFLPLSYIPTKDESDYLSRLIQNFALEKEMKLELREIRKYPAYGCTKDIIGTIDENQNGVSGIEKLYNDELKAIPQLGIENVKGSSIVLTLDSDLQFALEHMPELSDYADSTIAILSSSNEIVAYHGTVNEELLQAMVYSITDKYETKVLQQKSYFDQNSLHSIENYKVYIDSADSNIYNSLLSGARRILFNQGKIKSYSSAENQHLPY